MTTSQVKDTSSERPAAESRASVRDSRIGSDAAPTPAIHSVVRFAGFMCGARVVPGLKTHWV
jgi:hypothetical protein